MKSIIWVIATLFLPLFCFSQNNNAAQSTPFITPSFFSNPSPTAASLGKFGLTQVTGYTGMAQINVPLWEAKGSQLSLPISLNYNNNGLKVTEEASWVGLGWALQAGGIITQSVQGFPDALDGRFQGVLKYEDIADKSVQLQLNLVGDRMADGSPDFFIFNFGPHTGKFFIYNDKVYQFSYSDLNISYDKGSSSFTVITGDGTTYRFTKREQSVTTTTIDDSSSSYSWPSYETKTYSWLLTEIVSADLQDRITLTYATDAETINDPDFIRKSQSYQQSINSGFEADPCNHFQWLNLTTSVSATTITSYRLQQIETTREKIEFIPATQPRTDINGNAYALSAINVRDKTMANTPVVRTFNFTTSYFGAGSPTAHFTRLKLESVYESGNGSSKPPYTFTYYYPAQNFPDKTGFAMDHWGFFNGKFNVNLIPPTAHQNFGTADRRPVLSAALTGVLQTITYPTGGDENFTYEQNTYLDGNNNTQVGPGVRVLLITAHDGRGGISYKNYHYRPMSMAWLNTGYEKITNASPGPNWDCQAIVVNPLNPDVFSIFGSTVNYDVVTELQGLSGEGGMTTSYYQNIGLPELANGMNLVRKIVRTATKRKILEEQYSYQQHADISLRIILNPIVEYNEFCTGYRSSEYNIDGIPGRKNHNSPTIIYTSAGPYPYEQQTFSADVYDILVKLYYSTASHSLTSSWNYLNNKSTVTYAVDTTQSSVVQTNYYYGSSNIAQTNPHFHRYITSQESTLAQDRYQLTVFKYPLDYDISVQSGGDASYNALKSMQQLNMLNKPVETLSAIRTATGTSVVGGQLSLFKEFYPGIIKPAALLGLETTSPLPNSNFSSTTGAAFNWDSHFVPRLQYDYNNLGNLISWQKNQLQYALVWDDAGTHLLAKTQGATPGTSGFTSFESGAKGSFGYDYSYCVPGGRTGQRAYQLYGGPGIYYSVAQAGDYELLFWAQSAQLPQVVTGTGATITSQQLVATAGNWNQFRVFIHFTTGDYIHLYASNSLLIDEVRLHPVGAQMTSFTYNSLVGLTSQTDASGRTTTYEYDDLGRLNCTRDEQGSILGQEFYHFAGHP